MEFKQETVSIKTNSGDLKQKEAVVGGIFAIIATENLEELREEYEQMGPIAELIGFEYPKAYRVSLNTGVDSPVNGLSIYQTDGEDEAKVAVQRLTEDGRFTKEAFEAAWNEHSEEFLTSLEQVLAL